MPCRMRAVGHGVDGGLGEDDAVGLHIAEEEKLVADDGEAEGGAELVLAVLGDAGGGEVTRVEDVVAEVLPKTAVDLVGTGFEAGVEDGTGGVAELGAVVAGVDLELGEGVRRGPDDVAGAVEEVDDVDVVVDAIEEEVVLL